MATGLVAAVLVSSPRSDADRVGYYVGGDVGTASAEVGLSDLDAGLRSAFDSVGPAATFRVTSDDRDDLTYGAIVGYRFSAYLAVEGQYLWLGEYSLAADSLATEGEVDAASRAASGTWHFKGPAATALGSWPVSSRWDVYARAGAFWAQTDATLQRQSASVSERAKVKDTTTELVWGVGAAYHASPQWTVRLEYQQIPDLGAGDRTGEFDVERYTLGWAYSY